MDDVIATTKSDEEAMTAGEVCKRVSCMAPAVTATAVPNRESRNSGGIAPIGVRGSRRAPRARSLRAGGSWHDLLCCVWEWRELDAVRWLVLRAALARGRVTGTSASPDRNTVVSPGGSSFLTSRFLLCGSVSNRRALVEQKLLAARERSRHGAPGARELVDLIALFGV